MHGLPTPRASFLNSWQTNTCLTSFAFAQIETKRRTRVSFFFHARSFLNAKNADRSRHVAGRDRHQLTALALKDSDVGATSSMRQHSYGIVNGVGLGIKSSSLKRSLMLSCRTRSSYIQNAVGLERSSTISAQISPTWYISPHRTHRHCAQYSKCSPASAVSYRKS